MYEVRGQRMLLKKLSRKQKIYLLILGLIVIVILMITGKISKNDEQIEDKTPIANEELLILGIPDTVEGLENNQVYTDQGIYFYEEEIDWMPYLFQSVQAVTEDNYILHINNLLQREVKLENCLITNNTTENITVFSEGFRITMPCRNLSANFFD